MADKSSDPYGGAAAQPVSEDRLIAVHPLSQARRILLVEDDALIGLMLEHDLLAHGFTVLGPFASCAATLAWLDGQVPDAAILDITLTDGPCVELARALRERQIPFLVFTGQPPNSPLARDFAGGPWIGKPSSADHIMQTLREILEPGHPTHGGHQS
jgi:DNA-binding response OmpR family regulator